MTIEKLMAIDLEKVKYESLKETAKELIDDYNESDDKKIFKQEAKTNIEAVYKMLATNSPEALPADEKSTGKKKDTAPKNKKKLTKKELDAFDEDLKICRAKMKEYREAKKAGEPEKSKPKRHEKIRQHLISIGNLVPENLKDNLDVLEKIEELLAEMGTKIMTIYRMDELKIKEVVEDIKEKYDKKEEKVKKQQDE